MKLKPLGDRVVVEPLDAEQTTAGGIILPDTAKEKPTRGRVVAVGPGAALDDGSRAPLAVQVGDVVVYNLYGGTDVTVEDTDYKVLRESDILAKVSNK